MNFDVETFLSVHSPDLTKTPPPQRDEGEVRAELLSSTAPYNLMSVKGSEGLDSPFLPVEMIFSVIFCCQDR